MTRDEAITTAKSRATATGVHHTAYSLDGLIYGVRRGIQPYYESRPAVAIWHRADDPLEDRVSSRYRTVLADPPWPYRSEGPRAAPEDRPNSWDGVTGATDSKGRYGAMSISDLCALRVRDYVAANAHLYLWLTNAFLVEAHQVARAWGFKPKTMITWGKTKGDGTPSMKTGFYYRGATEHLLFCVRGVGRLLGPPRPTLVLHPRLPHSRKPECFYGLIEEQSPGPYLEIFARPLSPLFPVRPGWHTWGNEMPSDVDLRPLEAA
jgi:N6-adenosine-specific RNA methylase IME4